MNIAYLVSEFPAISHTFILYELEQLEKIYNIYTISVNQPKNFEIMDEREKIYSNKTFYIKKEIKNNFFRIFYLFFIRKFGTSFKILFNSFKLHYLKGPKSIKKSIGYFIEAIFLLDYIEEKNISHVHVHFGNNSANLMLLLKDNCDFSLSIHGPEIFYNTRELLLEEKFKEARFIRAISFFCQSQIMRFLNEKMWKKIHIIHCGVDTDIFTPNHNKNTDEKIILSVGRLCKSKGQILLLKVLEKIDKKIICYFIGGGEDYDYINKYIKEKNIKNIKLLGPKPRSETLEWLKKCEIFLLPSFAEGVPVSLMEAMSMGKTVISTKINGIEELIDNGINGYVVQASNKKSLKEIIEKVIDFDQKDIGNNSRRKIIEEFNIKKEVQKLVEVFEEYM